MKWTTRLLLATALAVLLAPTAAFALDPAPWTKKIDGTGSGEGTLTPGGVVHCRPTASGRDGTCEIIDTTHCRITTVMLDANVNSANVGSFTAMPEGCQSATDATTCSALLATPTPGPLADGGQNIQTFEAVPYIRTVQVDAKTGNEVPGETIACF